MQCTLDVYGSDAVVWGDWGGGGGGEKKREIICVTHRQALFYKYRWIDKQVTHVIRYVLLHGIG